jgi:hypothetical protein
MIMRLRITPHLIAAAVIVLAALVICSSPLLSGAGDYRVLVTTPRVISQGGSLLPASVATDAVMPAFSRPADGNPFTLRKSVVARGPRIGLPPPPPLTPPTPPVLPLPELP